MEKTRKMWVVLTRNHPNTGGASICDSTMSERKSDSIQKFISGSGSPWRYWKKRFNFCCEQVTVTIKTIKP